MGWTDRMPWIDRSMKCHLTIVNSISTTIIDMIEQIVKKDIDFIQSIVYFYHCFYNL